MRVLIDCEKVFERLTRGPFPNGSAADVDVQSHVDACHECRSLAESLRPAVALLHESMLADERGDLPEYCPRAEDERLNRNQERIPILDRPAVELANAGTESDPWRNLWRNLCWVLAPALLLAVIGLASQDGRSIGPFSHHGEGRTQQVALGSFSGIDLLASFDLPAVCLPNAVVSHNDPAELNDAFQCCSKCHNAMNPQSPKARCIGQLTLGCVACHSQGQGALCCETCHESQPASGTGIPAHSSTSCVVCHKGYKGYKG